MRKIERKSEILKKHFEKRRKNERNPCNGEDFYV